MRNHFGAIALVFFPLLLACPPAAIGPRGYTHPKAPFSVKFAEPGTELFISRDWQVVNFYKSEDSWSAKSGVSFRRTSKIDSNNDGVFDCEFIRPKYELDLQHRTSSARIRVRHEELPVSCGETTLRTLAKSYATSLMGAQWEGRLLSPELKQGAAGKENRYAVKITEESEGSIASRPSYSMTLELADVDQLQLGANAMVEKLRTVLIRPPYDMKTMSERSVCGAPVVLVVELSSSVEDFSAHESDFQKLLGQIEFVGLR